MIRYVKDRILRSGIPGKRGPAVMVRGQESRTIFSRTAGYVGWTYDDLVGQMSVPSGRTAYERTVRFHELVHARSNGLFAPIGHDKERTWVEKIAHESVGDAYVHAAHWPADNPGMIRDAYAAALLDVRAMLKEPPRTNSEFNLCLGTLLRCAAIALHAASSGATRLTVNELYRWVGKLEERGYIAAEHREAFSEIAAHCIVDRREKKREALEKQFLALLLPEDDDNWPDWMEEDARVKKYEPPEATGTDPAFKIVDPPKHASCNSQSRKFVISTTGAHLAGGSRLVRAYLGQTRRIARRRLPAPPTGSFLIDASGSMGVTHERLSKLCLALPGWVVAYYDGASDEKAYGRLVIYAKNGRRLTSLYPLCGGGNVVDYPSLRWLLTQPKPRFFVTDRQFCGGSAYWQRSALALLHASETMKEVTVIHSFDEAIEQFEKKPTTGVWS